MAENINLEDFILAADANLHEFSVTVCKYLGEIATSPEVMLKYEGMHGALKSTGTAYAEAIESLQKLRETGPFFIDGKAILVMQATRKQGSPCEVIVHLRNSKINTSFFPDNAENELYEHIKPYLHRQPGIPGAFEL
jgi:hypothetical protein